MQPKEGSKFNRRSIRLKEYDYSQPGFYFVTICVKGQECVFGEVIKSENPFDGPAVRLSEIGEIAESYWLEIPNYYGNIELDEWIIMPNHIHGIFVINDDMALGAIHELPLQKFQ